MKKTCNSRQKPTSMRSGFALILTLSVLTVVIALTGVLIGYMDSARRDAQTSNAMIQANLYFADVKNVLMRFKSRKQLYSTLYLTPVPLSSPDGRFQIMLRCHPRRNGININWLAMGEVSGMQSHHDMAQTLFEALVQQYELKDPGRLEEMLIAEIQGKDEFFGAPRLLRQKDGIISYRQFEEVVARYELEADDTHASIVPWKDYFVFLRTPKDPKANKLSGDYLSKKLISALFGIDMATLNESWEPSNGALKALLSDNGIDYPSNIFAEGIVGDAECAVNYLYAGKQYKFTFVDSNGEVKNFEFYGK